MTYKSFSTSDNVKCAIIALHGWTGDVNSMIPIANGLNMDDTKWLFPQAPYNASEGGYSWFDGEDDSLWNQNASFKILNTLIKELHQEGFQHRSIFLIGFSQGACLAIEFMIRQSFVLGGIIPVAGFIRYKKKFRREASTQSKKTPVLLIHGDKDRVIDPEQSVIAKELFRKCGYKVELKLFSTPHKFPFQGNMIIKNFIEQNQKDSNQLSH